MLPMLWTATTRRMQIHLDLVTLQTLPSSQLLIQVRAPDAPPAAPQILTLGFLHLWGWRFLNSYERYFCICTANRGLSGLAKDWTKAFVFLQNWNPKDIYLPTYLPTSVCVCVCSWAKELCPGVMGFCRLWKLYISSQVITCILLMMYMKDWESVHDLWALVVGTLNLSFVNCGCLFQSLGNTLLCSTQLVAETTVSGSSLLLQTGVLHLISSMLLVLLMLNLR
jgi:hypothetical protein